MAEISMRVIFALLTIMLMLIACVTAFFGPKWWLKISFLSSILLAVCMSLMMGIVDLRNSVATAICLGVFFPAFIVGSGWWIKRCRW